MRMKLYFSRPKKFKLGSWIIMKRLRTNYSHVAIEVSTGPIGLQDIYEASHGDVHSMWADYWKEDNIVVEEFIINAETREYIEAIRYLKKQRQKKYGFWTALASTIPFFRNKMIGKDGGSHFICSELIAKALNGVIDFKGEDLDYITPDKLRELL